ncbi:MAG: hypothetical protein R2748_02230 [Bryobacterales bacterium]
MLVADERVAESFEPGGGEIDWLMFGWSVFHCLHVGMTESPSRCTGTVMRPTTFEGYAREAEFNWWRCYRLRTILPVLSATHSLAARSALDQDLASLGELAEHVGPFFSERHPGCRWLAALQ